MVIQNQNNEFISYQILFKQENDLKELGIILRDFIHDSKIKLEFDLRNEKNKV